MYRTTTIWDGDDGVEEHDNEEEEAESGTTTNVGPMGMPASSDDDVACSVPSRALLAFASSADAAHAAMDIRRRDDDDNDDDSEMRPTPPLSGLRCRANDVADDDRSDTEWRCR